MIKVRISALNNGINFEHDIIDGELLSDSVKRVFENNPNVTESPEDIVSVVVNGKEITKDLWIFTKLKTSDDVIIYPKLKSGDNAAIFSTLVVIAATVYLGPLVAGTAGFGFAAGSVGYALTVAGVAAIASFAMNQLIPPPVIGTDGLDGGSGLSNSQMYSISSQGNAARKFTTVPKVYGVHRMFPVVAANPYVELEVDPDTGQLAQFLYAIYDFGYGPNVVRDLKIGNTAIEEFTGVMYNFVDLKKPLVNEGVWDEPLQTDFTIYRGDVSTEVTSYALNGNQNTGSAQPDYEVVRNAGTNPNLKSQEIALNFTLPRGLYSLSSTGETGYREIVTEIFFSKVGEDNWIQYSDEDFVDRYYSVGGDSIYSVKNLAFFGRPYDYTQISIFNPDFSGYDLPVLSTTPYTVTSTPSIIGVTFGTRERKIYTGIPAGRDYVYLPWFEAEKLTVGDFFYHGAQFIGKVSAITNVVLNVSKRVQLDRPLVSNIPLWTYIEETKFTDYSTPPGAGTKTYYTEGATNPNYIFQYRKNTDGKFIIRSNLQETLYATVKFTPKVPGEYKVKITRISTSATAVAAAGSDLTLTNINTRTDSSPILTDKRHTFMEVRIKASGQLNGSLQNLSGVVSSVLDVYDGSTWSKQESNNPAWVYADILTSEVNKKPIAKSRLDLLSLKEWADYCDEIPVSSPTFIYTSKRFASNFILDFDTTVQRLITQVSGAAQASPNLVDGKYGVLIDKRRTVPIQIFTTRNSSGFSSRRLYRDKPDALKVTFISPAADWQPNEVVVYDNGFNVDNASTFDEITTFAVTDLEQATRFGRFFLAQNRLRQETITIKVDFEYLRCTRGDYVQFVQDVMKVGGTPARVISIVGNRVKIDEGIETDPLYSYGFVYRSGSTGLIQNNTLSIVNADTFDLDGPNLPQVGDLIIIGVTDQIVFDCVVKAINPDSDLTATLTLLEKADEIYDIDQVDSLPEYTPQISPTVNPDIFPPGPVTDLEVTENTYRILTSGYEYYITTEWNPPEGAAFEFFEVYVDNGYGYVFVGSTEDSYYKYIVDQTKLGVLHNFKVLAVSATGKKMALGEVGFVSATPNKKSTPPSDVLTFNSDITSETLQLFWTKVTDLDIREYIIRFSPDVTGTWETSTILSRQSGNTDLYATQARTGVYLIKAVDFAGNESTSAAAIITTIPQLNGLNIIETLNDFPALIGVMDRVEKTGDTLVLQKQIDGPPGTEQYYSEGYYYYEDLLDLGEVYTVRLQSLLRAEGLVSSDIMANWNPLSNLVAMYSPGSSDWDVQAEYRATNSLNVIADWNTLDEIETISAGSEDKFTEWRKFIIGDATGRIFQFRLKLISNKIAVSPRVLNGTIKADMPDRVESYSNLIAPVEGFSVNYSPAFKGPALTPNVQITLENGQSGDYWQFTSKTLQGFTIVFYDKTDNPVERQFDALARGYGRRATDSI